MPSLPSDFFERLARPPLHEGPHACFDQLRSMCLPRLATGEIVLVHHADAVAVLRSGAFAKPPVPTPPGPMRVLGRMFLLIDGEDHQRLRRAVAPLFSPPAVAAREEEIRHEAERFLDRDARLDVISDYAGQLPLRLTGRWLGVGSEDQSMIRAAGTALTAALDAPVPTNLRHAVRFARAVLERRARPIASGRAVTTLVRIARSRLEAAGAGSCPPEAVFLERLSQAQLAGDLDEQEAIATWILLLIAGYETTANLVGTAMYHLLARPEVLTRVSEDSSLIPDVIEETLRFDGPVPVTARVATEDVELPSGSITAGQTVIVALIAANRDPEVFDDPNRFDIERDASRHLGFGHGAHICVGAHLARAEARTALQVLLDRGPEPAGDPRWREAFGTRGIATLPVTLRRV